MHHFRRAATLNCFKHAKRKSKENTVLIITFFTIFSCQRPYEIKKLFVCGAHKKEKFFEFESLAIVISTALTWNYIFEQTKSTNTILFQDRTGLVDFITKSAAENKLLSDSDNFRNGNTGITKFVGRKDSTAKQIVDSWYEQKQFYDYKNPDMSRLKEFGTYLLFVLFFINAFTYFSVSFKNITAVLTLPRFSLPPPTEYTYICNAF